MASQEVFQEVHVASHFVADVRGIGVAVAHHVDGIDVEMFCMGFDVFQVGFRVAAGAVQEYQRWAVTGFDGACPYATGVVIRLFEFHSLQVVPDSCHCCLLYRIVFIMCCLRQPVILLDSGSSPE